MFVEEALPFDYRVPKSEQRTVQDVDADLDREERMERVRRQRAAARRKAKKDNAS